MRSSRPIVTSVALMFSFLTTCAVHVQGQTPGTFTYTGSLNNSLLDWQTATVLASGKVLVAGGNGINGVVPTPSLYDPLSGTFAHTGGLVTPRQAHTATLLNNGMVLIVGGAGFGNGNSLSSAELYDPVTGTFAVTGSLNTPRSWHTATLLKSGMVLIVGGIDSSHAVVVVTAELYNPATGTFSVTGSPNVPRWHHTATLLNNGMVLAAGGRTNYSCYRCGVQASASAELYNPANGTFTSTGSMTKARLEHTATLLNSGGVLVAGGYGNLGQNPESSAELYNPTTGMFTVTGSLNLGRYFHTATLLNNGTVLTAGGIDLAAEGTFTAELYDPSTGVFSTTGNMNQARTQNSATLLNNGLVLDVAGTSASGYVGSAEVYDPTGLTPPGLLSIALTPLNPTLTIGASLSFTATGNFSGGGTQTLASATWSSSNISVAAVTNDWTNYGTALAVAAGSTTIKACAGSVCGTTTLTVVPHSNLILGSECGDASGGTFEVYDDGGNLKQTGNFSTLVLANHSATLLKNGTVFVAGGNGFNCTGSSATWEIISPNGQILSSGLLQNGRNSPASTLLQNGNVFLAGGQASPTSFDGTWEIRSPAGAFVASGLLNDVRGPGVSAVTLQNGNIWVSGSSLISSSACTYEIHGPTGALVASGSLQSCFAGAQVQALNNGNVILLGGDNAPGTYEIRTQTGAFVSTGSLVSAFNEGASSALLNNGNVFIFGSCAQPGQPTKFDPDNPPSCPSPGAPSTWEIRDQNGNFVATGSLFDQRAGAGAAVLSNGNIFITGGGLCPGCWEIWTQNGQFVSLGSLFDTRYGGHTLTHF